MQQEVKLLNIILSRRIVDEIEMSEEKCEKCRAPLNEDKSCPVCDQEDPATLRTQLKELLEDRRDRRSPRSGSSPIREGLDEALDVDPGPKDPPVEDTLDSESADDESESTEDEPESLDDESEKPSLLDEMRRLLRIGPYSRLRKPTAEERMEQIRTGERQLVWKREYRLPETCPGCGVEIGHNDVQWVDDENARCLECQTMMKKDWYTTKRPTAYHADT